MNANDHQQKPKDEEVDLGGLFMLIGNGFKKLFNFIGGLFVSLFNFLIIVLLFIRHHFIVLILSLIIGGALGFYSEDGKKSYAATMVVKPNLNSARQLYNNVAYFNDLAAQKEFSTLSVIFNLSNEEAKSLATFTIEPIISYSLNVEAYNDFVRYSDTTTVKQVEFKDFVKNQIKYDYKFHEIKVEANNNKVFSKLKAGLIASFYNNDYLVSLKNAKALNIETDEKRTNKNLEQADSLRQVYNKVLLLEANKPFSGTNIDMAQGKDKRNKELELFNTQDLYRDKLIAINKDKAENQNIINVVSDFNKLGTKTNVIYRKPGTYAFMLFGLTFLGLLLVELNKYLKTYKKP